MKEPIVLPAIPVPAVLEEEEATTLDLKTDRNDCMKLAVESFGLEAEEEENERRRGEEEARKGGGSIVMISLKEIV